MPLSAPTRFRCAEVAAIAFLFSFTIGSNAHAGTCQPVLSTSTLFIGMGATCSTSGEQKIFLDKGIGNTVSGNVGSRTGTPIADFTSSSSLRAANGFSTIAPYGAHTFSNLNISIEPTATSTFTFGDLAFGLKLAQNASLTIEAFDASNTSLGTLTLTNSELKHSKNSKFLVMANSTDLIASVLLQSSGLMQIKQFSIADLTDPPSLPTDLTDPPAATPLPAGLPLFATGIGILGLLGWRRKRKGAATIAA
jgi:hypothetical protein